MSDRLAKSPRPGDAMLVAVHERNARIANERRDWRKLAMVLAGALVLSVLCITFLAYKYVNVQRDYFATDSTGRLTPIYPLGQPLVPAARVKLFALEALQTGYNVDFNHFRTQLDRVDEYFTVEGAKSFKDELAKTGFLKKLEDELNVSSAVPASAPVIVNEGPFDGRYRWQIEVPLLLTLQNSKSRQNQTLKLTVIVSRVSQAERPEGIAVDRVVYAKG